MLTLRERRPASDEREDMSTLQGGAIAFVERAEASGGDMPAPGQVGNEDGDDLGMMLMVLMMLMMLTTLMMTMTMGSCADGGHAPAAGRRLQVPGGAPAEVQAPT